MNESDDLFAEVYDLEKERAKLLAEDDDGWLQVNDEIGDIQKHWSAKDHIEYASYKRERQQEEMSRKNGNALSSALKRSRREYEAVVKDVTGTDVTKMPKKKVRKNTAVAEKKSNKTDGKKKASKNNSKNNSKNKPNNQAPLAYNPILRQGHTKGYV